MNQKYILYIGLNDKDTKVQKVSTLEAYKIVENIIVEQVGGGSIYEGRGVYKHDNGQIVIEKSLQVELYDCTEETAKRVAELLKIALNQESVVLSSEQVETKFI